LRKCGLEKLGEILVGRATNDFQVGLFFSLLGHGMLFYSLLFLVTPRFSNLGAPVVYSVTLEGGKTLGGISQVPLTDKKTLIAPPKNVSVPPEKGTEKKAGKEKAELDKKEGAQVSLAEKKEETKPAEKKGETKPEQGKKEGAKDGQKNKPLTAGEINKQYQQAMQRYLGESADAGGKGFGAARLGGSGMGGGVLRPPEFFRYRDLLKNHIKKGWRWYDTTAQLTAWVYFELRPDGTIDNVSLAQSSGNREYDESVLRAVYKASPAPPPPESVYQFFEKVRIEFQPGD